MGVYHDTGLTNGTTYYYTVTAVNAQGESVGSTQIAVKPTSAPIGAATASMTTRVHLGASPTLISSIVGASARFNTHIQLQAGPSASSGTKAASAAFHTRAKISATSGSLAGPRQAATQFKTHAKVAATGTKVTMQSATAQFALNNKLRATGTTISTVTTAANPKGVQQYRVVMVNMQGVPQVELANANVTTIDLELNQPGDATFELPTRDPQNTIANISCWGNEVQIWRKGILLFWGVPTRIQTTSQTTQVQCSGLMVYFQKRFVGKANRDNLIGNPSFETANPNDGGWFGPGITGSIDTSHVISGTQSLRLDQATAGVDTSWQQNVGNLQANTLYILSASCHIWGDVGALHPEYQLGPAFQSRGLYMELRDAGGNFITSAVANLDYPAGVTQRLTVSLNTSAVSNIAGAYLNVRLYGVGGITMWDAVELVTMESLSFQNTDEANVMAGLAAHAQDPNFSKSNLNIAINCPQTGVLTSVAYQWADHANIFDSMTTFNEAANGLDMDIVFDTAGTQRVYTTFYPKKGGTKVAQVLEFQKNLTDFTFDEDGENTTNSIIELGDGSGPDRYEGFAIDTSTVNGLVLELIESAPSGTSIDALYQVAASRLAQTKNIVMMPEVTAYDTADMPIIGVLQTGDILPVRIGYGRVQYQGNFRIVKMTITPQDDSVALTLNNP